MDDQGFLLDLARAAREEEAEERRRWDRWDRLNDGVLSPGEESDLRTSAATSVEDGQAFEAFRPLSPDFRARMVATIGPLVQRRDAAAEELEAPVEAPVRAERSPSARTAKSRGGFLFPWWRLGYLSSGLAAATALLFALRLPPMPAITIAVASAVQTSRGEEDEGPVVLRSGTGFRSTATPEAKLSPWANIELRCYVKPERATESKILPAPCRAVERHPRMGAMKIEGSLPADLPAGSATLWIVLAYKGRQPPIETIDHLPSAAPTRMRTWDAEPIPIEVRSP